VIVWIAWYTLPKYVWPFRKVDDALGVVYTHGIAGLFGGLLTGLLADPHMIVYLGLGNSASSAGTGAFYGHPHQLLVQFEAALTIIVWDSVVTAVILFFIKYVLRMNLRLPDADLEIGDVAVHGEEAYPMEDTLTALSVSAQAEASPTTEEPAREPQKS
jgi:Amt family ammonium transporter